MSGISAALEEPMPRKKSRSASAAGPRPAAKNSTAMTSAARVIGSAVGKVVARTGRLLRRDRAHAAAGSGESKPSDRTAASGKASRTPAGGAKKTASQKPARKRSTQRAARTTGETKTP
jgi:hypothetical protein